MGVARRDVGRDGRVFVRPDENAKSFAGGLVEADGFDRWWELANFYGPGPDCLAVVARPQAVHAEWRLVIGGRRVVAASQYRGNGAQVVSPGCPPEAASFAGEVANSSAYEPHPVYVRRLSNGRGLPAGGGRQRLLLLALRLRPGAGRGGGCRICRVHQRTGIMRALQMLPRSADVPTGGGLLGAIIAVKFPCRSSSTVPTNTVPRAWS